MKLGLTQGAGLFYGSTAIRQCGITAIIRAPGSSDGLDPIPFNCVTSKIITRYSSLVTHIIVSLGTPLSVLFSMESDTPQDLPLVPGYHDVIPTGDK
jgi:hypothetical protein